MCYNKVVIKKKGVVMNNNQNQDHFILKLNGVVIEKSQNISHIEGSFTYLQKSFQSKRFGDHFKDYKLVLEEHVLCLGEMKVVVKKTHN